MEHAPEESAANEHDSRLESLPQPDSANEPEAASHHRHPFNGGLLFLVNLLLALAVSGALQLTINRVVEKEWRLLEPYSTVAFGFNVAVFLALFSLVQVLCNRWLFSVLLSLSLVAFLGVVDIYKLLILNRPLLFRDFMLIGQLRQLMPTLTGALGGPLAGIGIGLGLMAGVMGWSWGKRWLSAGRHYRIGAGALSVTFITGLALFSANSTTEYDPNTLITNITWNQKLNYERNGFLLAFTMNASQILHPISKPAGYSEEAVTAIIDRFKKLEPASVKSAGCAGKKPVNVILILGEAFWDPTRLPVKFNEDPIPFFHSLQTSASTGNLISPTFGGYTAKTEFEILTGFSLSFMPEVSNPYATYMAKPQAALPAVFRANGYRALAVHPYTKTFWERARSYPLLGFEEFLDIESFKNPEFKGPFISDDTLVSKIIEVSKERSPYFLFAITMCSHAPYDYSYAPFTKGQIDPLSPMSDASRRTLRTYVNAINQTDRALKRLVEHFSKVDQKTLIVFFGDHLPMLGANNEVYTETGYLKSSDEFEKIMFDPPVVAWANYKLPHESLDRRANFLYSYIIEKAHLRAPIVSKVIAAEQRSNPLLTSKGMNDEYWMLQYDLLFGKQYALKSEPLKYTDSSLFVKQMKELYQESKSAPKPPEIVKFGPQQSFGLKGFTQLPNGNCPIWFETHHASPGAVVYLDEQPLLTTVPNSELVTAEIPPDAIAKIGKYKLHLYDEKLKVGSNEVSLEILDSEPSLQAPGAATVASAAATAQQSLGMEIAAWGPQQTLPGKPFNVQQDGSSAFWFTVRNATPTLVVTFDGKPLDTAQASSGSLSALLKPEALNKAGRHEIQILDVATNQGTPKVFFTVGDVTAPAPAPSPTAPQIVTWGPQQTLPGQPFSVQKDGSSAFWFTVRNASPKMVVTFDGKPLATAQAAGGALSAMLKPEALKKAGEHEIRVLDETTGQKSEMVIFTVGKVAKPVAAPPTQPAPQVTTWGPQQTLPGQPFNAQQDGSSAFWFTVKNASPKMVVTFDGKPLATAQAAGGALSAMLKPEALKKAGQHEIRVVDEATGQKSEPVLFWIGEKIDLPPAGQPAPQILGWGPTQTPAGKPFSQQPDGSCSMWFKVSGVAPTAVAMFDGKPLATFHSGSDIISANLPLELLKKAGKYRVWLQDRSPALKSNEVVFEVTQ